MQELKRIIDEGFAAKRAYPERAIDKTTEKAVLEALAMLDSGAAAVTNHEEGGWRVNQWLKKAILLYFTLRRQTVVGGVAGSSWYDKVPLKTTNWDEAAWRRAAFRVVPGAVIRYGSFVGKNAVLMPSFVNIGACVGEGTMIDTWATVGSCARVGKNCHISGGAGIGGVLEPLQASPVVVEDDCFIGARSEIAEGVVVGEGSVVAMGVYIGASTKIITRDGSKTYYGEVPPYSVVVPGSRGGGGDAPSLSCAVIIKRVDEKTRAKTSINDLLRER